MKSTKVYILIVALLVIAMYPVQCHGWSEKREHNWANRWSRIGRKSIDSSFLNSDEQKPQIEAIVNAIIAQVNLINFDFILNFLL